MTEDQIIEWARKADLGAVSCTNSIEGDRVWLFGIDVHDELTRFAALVAQHERESCALVCDDLRAPWGYSSENAHWIRGTEDCAAAIRARGEP